MFVNRCADEVRRWVQPETLVHYEHKGDPLYRIRRLVLTTVGTSMIRHDAALWAPQLRPLLLRVPLQAAGVPRCPVRRPNTKNVRTRPEAP